MTAPLIYHRTTPLSDAPYERILIKFTEAMVTPLIDIVGRPAFDSFYHKHVYHFTSSMQKKLFKNQVGTTYSVYLNSIKLQHVQQLLIQTNLSIREIAEKVGFVNSNYLCDVFRKYIGISPSKFRKHSMLISSSTSTSKINHPPHQ